MVKTVIGVMGPGSELSAEHAQAARQLGRLIAERGWVLLTGGRQAGVMDQASKGARDAGGLVVGVLPDSSTAAASPFVDIAILTDLGSARNNINVLSSRVVIACGMGPGTASEICLALKADKDIVLLMVDDLDFQFFSRLGRARVQRAADAEAAVDLCARILGQE